MHDHLEPQHEPTSIPRPGAPRGLRAVAVAAEAGNARCAIERAGQLDLAPGARGALLLKEGAASSEARLEARFQAAGGQLTRLPLGPDDDMAAAVAGYVERHAPELVVIAREPRGLFARLLGATPEKLARYGRVPVLVTRLPAERPYQRLLVGIDGSDGSRQALELALRLKAPESGGLDVLHCHDTSYALVMHQTGASAGQLADYHRERHARAEERLRGFLAPYRARGANLRAWVISGDPHRELPEAASQQGAELLVIGKRVRQGLGHALVGSVAEACLRRAGCDVLVVPWAEPPH